MNWYKRLKTSKWKGEGDPYLQNKSYHGTGDDLHRPGQDSGYGADQTNETRLPEFSELEERITQHERPKEHDGGEDPPPMEGGAFFRSPDDPNSIEQQTERALNTDIKLDKRKGVHNMNGSIFDTVSKDLRGV
jgi:hypothetical protein